MVRSELQKQILSFYRECLREAYKKPKVSPVHLVFDLQGSQGEFVAYFSRLFRENVAIPRRNVMAIEHLLRAGRKRLDYLRSPSVKNISFHKQ